MLKPKRSSRNAPNAVQIERRDQRLLQAVIAWRAGRFDDAERGGLEVLEITPRHAPALQLLGMIAGKTGRVALGIERLSEAVAADPANADAHNEFATLLRANGEFSRAAEQCRQALRHRPSDAGTYNNLGLALLEQRDLAGAVAAFNRGVAIDPGLAMLHVNLGIAYSLQGRNEAAEVSLRRAIALAPDLADAHARLGHLLALEGREEAQACFTAAISHATRSAQGRAELARLLFEAGQLDLAELCLREAIAVDPAASFAHEELGVLLMQRGRFGEATASFERAIELSPTRASVYRRLVSARRITTADRPFVATMRSMRDRSDIDDDARVDLHYALGKAHDDLGEYESAMREFDAANALCATRLRRAGRALDRDRHAANVDSLMTTYTRDFFERHGAIGSREDVPVLVVGMIRSGTTLVEQILSSHRDIGAAGELRFWGDRAIPAGSRVDASAAAALAQNYVRLLRGTSPGTRYVVDKMPTNFLLLGTVHVVLPQARIVHCRRHPVDTALSIWFTRFGRLPDYAHDRRNIVFYYEQYAKLMAHWRRVLPPDRFFEVEYEALVADRERVVRELVEFCGLEWDAACLRHESNERAIRTPSAWQARQPVYRTSVERWRNYEPWLGELRELLDPHPR